MMTNGRELINPLQAGAFRAMGLRSYSYSWGSGTSGKPGSRVPVRRSHSWWMSRPMTYPRCSGRENR